MLIKRSPQFEGEPSVLQKFRRTLTVVFSVVACVFCFRAITPDATATNSDVDRPIVATTSVEQPEPQKPDSGRLQTIETVRLGQRVVGRNPLRHETQSPSDINPDTWRRVRLAMIQDGVTFDLEFLRSLEWVQSVGAEPSQTIHLQLPGIGLDGPATVDSVGPCPSIEPDDGTGRMVVTGTMKHLAPNVCNVYVSGLHEPLGVTTTHPIWSETRHKFVQVKFLRPGELLRTMTGVAATVVSIEQVQKTSGYVYNLEVDAEHVYHVSPSALLVHNENCVDGAWGLAEHLAGFRDSIAAATGKSVDMAPFLRLADDGNLEQVLNQAMKNSGRNHLNFEGFEYENFRRWLKSGGPESAPYPGSNNVTNWEIYRLLKYHLHKTTIYGGKGDDFIPWPFE